jgi:glutathione peroxidase
MKRSFFLAAVVTVSACGSSPPLPAAPPTSAATATKESPAAPAAKSLYSFDAKDIDGKLVHLDRYKGKVALVVNVASQCGYTPQYPGLQALYERHAAGGFVVLGFPSDQFGHQEPGTEEEIKTFCMTRYAVSFPLFAKIDVNGPAAHPLYVWLRAEQPGHLDKESAAAIGAEKLYAHLAKSTPEVLGTDAIKWNFTKFLVDRQGHVVKRFESPQTPESIEPEVAALLSAAR